MSYEDDYGHAWDAAAWDAAARNHAMTAILDAGDGTLTSEEHFRAAGRQDAERYLLSLIGEAGVCVDYGCGIGRLLLPVREDRPLVHLMGLDVSQEMLEQLHGYCGEDAGIEVRAVLGDGSMPELAGSSVDVMWSWLCLQHMEPYDAYRVLTEAARVLKPGGSFVATFPRLDSPAYGSVYRQVVAQGTGRGAGRMRLYLPDHVTYMFNDAGLAVLFLDRGENLVVRGVKP